MRNLLAAALLLSFGAAAQTVNIPVASNTRTVSPHVHEHKLEIPPFSIEHQVRLVLESRIDHPAISGSNPWFAVHINGTALTADNLLNKPNSFMMHGGMDLEWCVKGTLWRVLYAPDFGPAASNPTQSSGVPAKDEPFRYVWDITDLVRPGAGNILQVRQRQVLVKPATLVIRTIALEVGKHVQRKGGPAVTPAPTGPLPRMVPQGRRTLPITLATPAPARITLQTGNLTCVVDTSISLPDGRWQRPMDAGAPAVLISDPHTVQWQAGTVRILRKIRIAEDHVRIIDTFTNQGKQLAGVIVDHQATFADDLRAARLCGMPAPTENVSRQNPTHPSAFGQTASGGIGLLAEDDVFRVHSAAYRKGKTFGIRDGKLGVAPGKSVTLEWSIYPTPDGGYWQFVNAVRRNWDVNFTIPGPFVFHSFRPGLPPAYYGNWMRERGMNMVVGGIPKYENGIYAHGTGVLFAPKWVADNRDYTRKLRGTTPHALVMAYFHAQISTEPDGKTKYADCMLKGMDGKQIHYPYRYSLPLYLPTHENAYGKALERVIDTLADKVGVNGIYWDEMEYSVLREAWHAPWDGVTVRIHHNTHEVLDQHTSVPLITQPFRLHLIEKIRDKGLFLMGNGQAKTRTMTQQKLVRFVETGTYSRLNQTHLGCPLGLGNHHDEGGTQAASARNVREMLQRGTTYYGHTYRREPATWNFTDLMFPLTPIEIGPGFVIGKERILATTSGQFGWPDGAGANVTVVGPDGKQASKSFVKEVTDANGKKLYEVRIASDHFVILHRIAK
ncbi:MAG: hypothetical protein KAI66_01785 [Lentisphaeria bacterium]|nr:hypothetical protein [Lentisphaeria bacterium]